VRQPDLVGGGWGGIGTALPAVRSISRTGQYALIIVREIVAGQRQDGSQDTVCLASRVLKLRQQKTSARLPRPRAGPVDGTIVTEVGNSRPSLNKPFECRTSG
jgi:hypothetical protein